MIYRQPGWYFVGLDLGQAQDFTAIAALERVELTGEWDPVMYGHRKTTVLRLRYLKRLALGAPYPEMMRRVRDVVRSPDISGRCYLVVDATGVGRPVVDLLRTMDLECTIMPAVITCGDRESNDHGYYRVPKRDLIVGMQLLLQRGGLQIAAGLENGGALAREMAEMRVKVTAGGHEQYGAWREGEHDDLVFAVALGCWGAQRVMPHPVLGDDRWGGRRGQTAPRK